MFGTEDDDDFIPVASSKLASLFEKSLDQGNASLTYTAPKQPRKGKAESQNPAPKNSASQPPKLSIVIVKAVQTFKLEDGNYNGQGKLGAAVLGNPASRLYQLLLYKNKQQHITTTKITERFQFTVQPNKFASFYDDQRQNWSILFDSEQDIIDFAKEVGLACANSYGEQGVQPFYVQDLKIGDGQGAELGDLLEIRYTTSSLVSCSLGQEIETNLDAEKPQRVKIRKGVWEEALLGATKGCKKLITLTPVLFGPWKSQALPDSRLVVEVEVVRIKSVRKSREPTPTGLNHLADSSESNVDSSTDETSIKARGASISEALTNSPKTHKASIISRMARMGQATLPLKGAVVCNPSDSEETEEECSGVTGGPSSTTTKPVAKTRTTVLKPRSSSSRPSVSQEPTAMVPPVSQQVPSAAPAAQQLTVFTSPGVAWPQQQQQPPQQQYLVNGMPFTMPPQYSHFTSVEGQLYPAITQPPVASHQMFPTPAAVGTPPDSHLAVFVSESRAQNTELRMGISKIIDKVDQVMVKVDGLQPQRSSGAGPLGTLEPMVLVASIQKLVSDNELLQTELADKRSKLEQQNEKMYHLLHANQKFMEQNSSMMEQRQDMSLQATLLGLQQEKAKLAAELAEAVSKANSLQSQASNFERAESELSEERKNVTARLHIQQAELESSRETILEQEKKLHSLEENLKLSINLHQSQESTIAALKSDVVELQSAKAHVEDSLHAANQQLEQTNKAAAEQLALVTAVHKEKLEKLQHQMKNYTSYGDGIMHQNVNQQEEQLANQARELTDEYKGAVDILEKDKLKLKAKVDHLEEQLKAISISKQLHPASVVEDVKKIMNVMFRLLKSEFVPGTSYEGGEIRQILLATIKDVTLQYVNLQASCPKHPKLEKLYPVESNQLRVEEKSNSTDTTLSKPSPHSVVPPTPSETVSAVTKTSDTPVVVRRSPEPQAPSPTQPTSEAGVRQSRDSSLERGWRPQPPPSPLCDDEDDDDDWLS